MKKFLICTVVFILTALVFYRAVGYGFVILDDYDYLVSDTLVRKGFSWEGLRWAFTWVGDAMWTPLTWMSYMTDFSVFGGTTTALHLHSIVLHAACGVLVFLLFRRCSLPVAVLAALAWSVHPLRVESVVWLASRKDVLSTFFFLASLNVWIRAERTGGILCSLALLVLGGLAKSSVMVFPVFVLLVDWFVESRRKPLWAYVVAILLAAGLAVEASWAQAAGGATGLAEGIPFLYRLVNAVSALTIYLGNVICPTSLAPQCVLKWPALPRFSILGCLALIASAVVVFRALRRMWTSRKIAADPIFAGLLIFFVSLVPFLGIVGFGCHAFADRFTILPTLGISLILSEILRNRAWVTWVAGGVVSALAVMTVVQVGYWKDDGTLFERTIAIDGDDNMSAHQMAASYYYEYPHDHEKVYQHLRNLPKAPLWQQDQTGRVAHFLVEAAYATGRSEEAREVLGWLRKWGARQVLLQGGNPQQVETTTARYAEIIRLAYTDGQLDRARKELEKLAKIVPDDYALRNLRYIIAVRGGNAEEIASARQQAYSPTGDPYCANRWSLR